MRASDGKYLTFVLGDENYGIPILKVKEIIGMMEITKVPRTPDFIQGVINLRGKIVPIIDLRLKFKLEKMEYNERTCVIVVEVKVNDVTKFMGIAVDSVSEVVTITKDNIEPPPEFQTDIEEAFLEGMGKVKDKVIMLLNIEKVLSKKEFSIIKDIKEKESDLDVQ